MSQFKVVLQNAISEEYTQLEVEQNLARLLKISDQKIEKLLSRPETTVKKGVDSDIAEKYKKLIERCGLSCEIRPMDITPVKEIPESQHPQETESNTSVYAPPKAELSPEASKPYKLYSIEGVGIATFFGSILAGGIIMWINLRRLGRFESARKTILYSILATILFLFGIIMIPQDINIPSMLFTIPQIFAMVMIAKSQQKDSIDAHKNKGGEIASNWKAFGIGLLSAIPVLAGTFLIAMLLM